MKRRNLVVAVVSFALLGLFLWRMNRPSEPAPSAEVAAPPPAESPAPADPQPDDAQAATVPDLDVDEPANYVEAEPAFASIDLESARAALPDNAYWEKLAPTTDPRLLGDRERAAKAWNEQYGKILAGDATEAEIQTFFDDRMRLSSDYVRFADWVIEHQGPKLSDQDLELLHVAKRLHLARVEEVPRRMQEALDRKKAQDAAREAWLAEQRAFESDSASDEATPNDAAP